MEDKILLKETKNNPADSDIAVATEYENHAARDDLAAQGEVGPATRTWPASQPLSSSAKSASRSGR
jgi:hypothetical protein